MRASKQEGIGTAGQNAVASQFEMLGWGVAPNPDHDLGTDLWLMARDHRRFDLKQLVGAQVKTGADRTSKYFREPAFTSTGELRGWWFRESSRNHFEYWLEHSVAHIVVLHRLDRGASYWVQVTKAAVEWTGKGAKILVPIHQTVDMKHFDELLAVAASKRTPSAWERSAWTGAADLIPELRLRYAMVTPRLVSPHPNSLPDQLDPVSAVAMLVQVRLAELGHLQQKGACPTLDVALDSETWEWRLFGALHRFIETGDPTVMDQLHNDADTPGRRSTALVLTASGRLEDGKAREACELIDACLALDDADPVDYAWLQVQKGRCLAELGRLKESRELGIQVQSLYATAGHDPTAMAIAAAAAELVFLSSDWGTRSVGDVITATDTPASWWRSQAVAWGLDDEFDKEFKRWANDTAVTFGGGNRAWCHLRAASLIANFAGDHASWRHAVSLLARLQLKSTNSSGPVAVVHNALTCLRWAGDESSLKLATLRALGEGPADAVRLAGADLDLSQSTRTSSKADLAFISAAADVLDVNAADRAARWAMEVLDDPRTFIERIKPTYNVGYYVLEMLTALIPAISDVQRREIRHHIVELPPQPDQLMAHRYASLIDMFDDDEWSQDDRLRLAERHDDNWELADKVASLLAQQNPSERNALLDKARAGSLQALVGLGDVTLLPPDVVEACIANLTEKVDAQIADARAGRYGLGGVDLGAALTVLNASHSEQAKWKPIEDLLAEPSSHPRHIGPTLGLLPRIAERIPPSTATAIAIALRQIMSRTPQPIFDETDVRGAAAYALDALAPHAVDDAALWSLMAGDSSQRQSLAATLARRRDVSQLNLLALLAHDSDSSVRTTTAQVIARWVIEGLATPASEALLLMLLDDSGTRVARGAVRILFEAGVAGPSAVVIEQLEGHISAEVRRTIDRFKARQT